MAAEDALALSCRVRRVKACYLAELATGTIITLPWVKRSDPRFRLMDEIAL